MNVYFHNFILHALSQHTYNNKNIVNYNKNNKSINAFLSYNRQKYFYFFPGRQKVFPFNVIKILFKVIKYFAYNNILSNYVIII